MAAEYGGAEYIEPLFDALWPAMSKRARHPVTGATISKPIELAPKAGLLNAYLYDPEVVMIWSKAMTYSHLSVWRDYINASPRRFAVISPSDKGREDQLAMLPSIPMWTEDTGFDPLKFVPAAASCRAALYPTNDRRNVPFMVHLPHLAHAHINHGDSDKASNASRFALAYDFVFVADPHAVSRFADANVPIQPDRILPVGASVIPGVEYRPDTSLQNVLYAPTFEGWNDATNFSSLGRAKAAMIEFAESHKQPLGMRPHHATGGRLKAYAATAKTLRSHATTLPNDKVQQFNWADVLVADVSGVTSEFLYTGKPIVIPVSKTGWLIRHIKSAKLHKFCYLWDYKEIGLGEFLASIADDPLRRARLARRRALYLNSETFEQSAALFERAVGYVMTTAEFRQDRHPKRTWEPSLEPDLGDLAAIGQRVREGSLVLRA